MKRFELRPCCCNSASPPVPNSRYSVLQEDYRGDENAPHYFDVDKQNSPYDDHQLNNGHTSIDPQTLNTISSLRKKACHFLRSESESSTSASPYQHLNVNQHRGSNLVRQANDLIDYEPQSEFLRKMKQQCQYLQNNQSNVFSTLDNCVEYCPHECQKCIERAKLVLTFGDQIQCNRFKSPAKRQYQNYSYNDQFGKKNNLDNNSVYPKDPEQFNQMNGLNDNQRLPRACRILSKDNLEGITEEIDEKILKKSSLRRGGRFQNKKSEHVSRSKKPAKSRGRRKQKSDSSDKCESEDEFEPNLKKPHENSCERCWRFASPSRSPVNKPDQRYDPNFRRGHSCVDFNRERGDGDLDVAGKRLSPCKNLQPITSTEKVPASSQAQPKRQHPEVIEQKIHFNPHKTECNSQEARHEYQAAQAAPNGAQYSPQAAQCSPRPAQYCPEMAQYYGEIPQHRQEHPQNQIKQNSSFTKVKELLYNYCRSKSPEKSAPSSRPCKGGQNSPVSPRILQSEAAWRLRPKSFPAGDPVLDPENLPPSNFLSVKDYCDVCKKLKQGLGQNGANKKSVKLNGQETKCPVGENDYRRPATAGSPSKTGTPLISNKSGPSPKASSTPKKSKPKTSSSPDHCNEGPSGTITSQPKGNSPKAPQPKRNSPKGKSPRTPINLNSPATPGTDSTVYAEVVVKNYDNPCTPKKSEVQLQQSNKKSPRTGSPKNGNSSKKGANKKSPRKVQSSANLIDNLSPIQEGRPQTMYEIPAEHDVYTGFRGMNDPHTGIHPIRDCWCPPRAPFIKGNVCNNPDPDHIFCCHCNWEENKKCDERHVRVPPSPQRNVAQNGRPNPQTYQVSDRQFPNDRNYASDAPRHESSEKIFLDSIYPRVEDRRIECPYRAFQREKRAANDTSWEADYQRLKEYCFKYPEELQYQVLTKTNSPFKNSEYLPTKYALFYMTENKQDKGDDVEVLVEELTQACPNKSDSRTKDITDKMKKIMECPSDSMALRFQKGVSDPCKTPRSSRILYF